ncbi:uncharacterized protein An14g06490 [Aspergillus niger]|uniref:Contig An14c0190, genomic contig n=2 Tax=Aspergillus niger TaxID=5061 RepID=A2R442_ASPNC|nr:uncharacterized protein An14g06490 [Aspergillus niger]CAK97222.1 unnamed protein product [Aspergillus niger]
MYEYTTKRRSGLSNLKPDHYPDYSILKAKQ